MVEAKKKKAAVEKTQTSDKKSDANNKTKNAKLQIAAATYILSWQSTACPSFADSIKKEYLDKLAEAYEIFSKRSNREEKDNERSLRNRLDEAIKKITDWESHDDEGTFKRKKELTLAELSVFFRLKVLLKQLHELSAITKRLSVWMLEHNNKLNIYANDMDILLKFAKYSFEAVATIAEVFKLRSIDRSQAKKEYLDLLGSGSGYVATDPEEFEIVPSNVRVYIKDLETRLNYLRTIVHIIGTSAMEMLQGIYHAVSVSDVSVRTGEIQQVLERLPPPYLFTEENLELSKAAQKLLSDPPSGRAVAILVPTAKSGQKGKASSSGSAEDTTDRHKSEGKRMTLMHTSSNFLQSAGKTLTSTAEMSGHLLQSAGNTTAGMLSFRKLPLVSSALNSHGSPTASTPSSKSSRKQRKDKKSSPRSKRSK